MKINKAGVENIFALGVKEEEGKKVYEKKITCIPRKGDIWGYHV